MSSRPGVMNAQQAKGMRDAGLVQIGGTRQGLGAIDRIGRYMMPQRPLRKPARRDGAHLADVLAGRTGARSINEYESKRLLSAFGVPVTREDRVTTLEEATRDARELGYPIVLKALSDDIPHKTELGLVAIGLANDKELARAFHGLQERLDRLEPRPSDAALLVQEFVQVRRAQFMRPDQGSGIEAEEGVATESRHYFAVGGHGIGRGRTGVPREWRHPLHMPACGAPSVAIAQGHLVRVQCSANVHTVSAHCHDLIDPFARGQHPLERHHVVELQVRVVLHTDRGDLTAPLIVDALGWRRVLSNAPRPIQPPYARLSRGLVEKTVMEKAGSAYEL
jgi:hypothetical protein